MVDESEPIDFTFFYFIGITRLKLTEKRVGRMTYYLFNKLYQHYKDVFDLELRLKTRDMTYRELYKKSKQEDEWF